MNIRMDSRTLQRERDRDVLRHQIKEMAASMSKLRDAKNPPVWNDCLQAWVRLQ